VISSLLAFNSTGLVFANYPVIISSILSIIANAFESKNIKKFLLLYAVAYIVGTLAEAAGLKYGLFTHLLSQLLSEGCLKLSL
jgi:uncharacterized membrane-anchored protein